MVMMKSLVVNIFIYHDLGLKDVKRNRDCVAQNIELNQG